MNSSPDSTWTWTIPADEKPARADRCVQAALERGDGEWSGNPVELSRSRIQALIDEGRVTADGKAVKNSAKLGPGTRVELVVPPPAPTEVTAENIPIEILFEDEHLVIVNKPPRLTVHPSNTQASGTLVNALLHQVKGLSGIGGVERPGIVHRLDKDTSGAMVIAKSDQAHRRLVEIFSEHAIERVYWALCYGAPRTQPPVKTGHFRVESLIGRNPHDRKKMAVAVKQGKKAITTYKTLEEYKLPEKHAFASWIEARLETGRTHQVRVHLTAEGYSLFGDPLYGLPTSKQPKWTLLPKDVQDAVQALPGQALHARVLGFAHPVSGKALRFEADPPPAFAALLAALRKFG